MNKLRSILCLLVLCTVFTCDNEPYDGDIILDSNNNEELIGAWNLLEFDVTVNTSSIIDDETIVSDIDIVSTNAAYVLEFSESTFTTQGSYSYNAEIIFDLDLVSEETYTLTDVMGSGMYSTNGNEMTIDGSFFEFEFQGVNNTVLQGEQTTNFEISDDGETLTFTQNETTTETDNTTGTVITSSTNFTSVWTRGEVSNICDAQTATDEAEAAFNEADTNEDLCNAYKTALENQIAECGDNDGSLQAIIDDLGDCSFSNMGEPGSLVVTVGTLLVDFINQNISLQDGIIVVDATSATGNYTIYFEVVEGATGINTFQNFVISFNGTEFFPSTQGVDDFESETTVSSQGILIGTFNGLVESSGGADLTLTQGMVDVPF